MDIELIENYFGFNDLKPSLFCLSTLPRDLFSLCYTSSLQILLNAIFHSYHIIKGEDFLPD